LDQGSTEGLRGFSGSDKDAVSDGVDGRCYGRQGRYCACARHGFGVLEIALASRGDAYRVVYAVGFGEEIWVIHAFRKKSTRGIKTPKHELDLIRERLKRLKEMLR